MMMIINFVGYNLALGLINPGEFGDKVTSGADIVFEQSVMNELAKKYFGAEIKNHQTVDFTAYADGKYTVPALGGVVEYPLVRLLIKNRDNEGIYYAVADYMTENPAEGKKLGYQYLIRLQKDSFYTIKAITPIEYPVNFELIPFNKTI